MSKSDSVQFRYREVSLDPKLMNGFSNEDMGLMAGEHQSDELQDCLQKLFERLLWLIDNKLTARQTQIVRMLYIDGKTQTEVARLLGLCQPSVHKSKQKATTAQR